MSKKKKILVGLSGGVDSSVAALLLKKQGYEVIGISMHLYSCHRVGEKSCCSAQDRLDAKQVCEKLQIPFVAVDYREEFQKKIIQPFVTEYLQARTPSPCILCNQYLKFGALYNELERLGADAIATGHYACIDQAGDHWRLRRGIEKNKDQSYFLFVISQENLKRTFFPIGELTKAEVRKIAAEHGLPTSSKRESQEICFVTDDDYAGFVEGYAPDQISGSGDFVDKQGKILGKHRGIHAYTIGQRRGLGFGLGKRQYVIQIDAKQNRIILGDRQDLYYQDMLLKDVHLICSKADVEKKAGQIQVQIRSTHKAAPAQLEFQQDGKVKVEFKEAQLMITPGQAAVFYSGDEVLGGGWII
ncbi:MAG: tRNA 2-thiouridine(34) synthase MnmA [Pseudomonadota bacterium]